MPRLPLLLSLLAATVALPACSKETTSGACSSNDDCRGGSVCVEGACWTICFADRDCAEGEICATDVCTAGQRDDAPVITSVDGNGSIDSLDGHTAHRIDDRLVILGEHFEGATVSLSDGSAEHPLEICEASSDRLVVTMPPSLDDGTYLLRVASQGGSCDASLPVLQGETGSAGSCDPSACTMQIYPGASQVTAIVATAVNPSGGDREQSLTLNGSSEIASPSDGVWVAALSRASHAPTSDPRFGRSYNPNDVTELNELVIALHSLTRDDFVIVVSRGDVSTRINEVQPSTTSLADELVRLGAPERVRALAGDEAFVLVGAAGLGVGNAAFLASFAGAVEMMATLVDASILGPRSDSLGGRELSAYQRTCTAAACSVSCDPGDLLVSCAAASDPSGDADDTDVAANIAAGTCSKGSNDPEYKLSAICLDLAR